MGIEPTSEAWEASILPLYDARPVLKRRQNITAFVRAQENPALLDFRIIEVVAM